MSESARDKDVRPVKIGVIISSMGPGGAERAMAILSGAWADRGWQVTIYSFDSKTDQPFHKVHQNVAVKPLDLRRTSHSILSVVRNNIRRIFVLRGILGVDRPDYILCVGPEASVLVALAAWRRRSNVIALERVHPEHHYPGISWRLLRRIIYPHIKSLVVQTQRVADHFAYAASVAVIPNPVIRCRDDDVPGIELKRPAIIGVGRLVRQKRFDVLIDAYARVAQRFPDWNLYIFGEGALRQKLADSITQKGLIGRIELAGLAKPIDSVLRQADLFVLSSDFEGFPNALCEAMACGVPVIATDCPSGPREIIRDGVDGVLIDPGDAPKLADAIGEMMVDPGRRQSIGRRGREVVERFGPERVIALWDTVLCEAP